MRTGQRVKYGSVSPAGSTYTISDANTDEWSTSTSTDLSVGLEEVVGASVSFEVGHTVSNTNTLTQSYKIDCNAGQKGQLYWYPYWNIYYGTLWPSGDELSIYVPIKGEEEDFGVDCLD